MFQKAAIRLISQILLFLFLAKAQFEGMEGDNAHFLTILIAAKSSLGDGNNCKKNRPQSSGQEHQTQRGEQNFLTKDYQTRDVSESKTESFGVLRERGICQHTED